ncbi:AIR synthase family protein [Candidatus Bathyarchaeota archaeon]|nr:AIR synthase family protein [Candidatus Bathyarchaeota archaeon]
MLKQLVFSCLGAANSRVILGPKIGEDASVIDFKDRVLVVHSDPITGAVENIGWLAVNIVANDIATRGVKPLWMLIVLLLPRNMDSAKLKHITLEIDKAAKELGIAIVGGHSEVTPGIKRPIIVATAMGESQKGKLVQSSGAKVGDQVILTKGAAIEGTAILASELAESLQRKINSKIVKNAQKFIKKISVVEDALTAVKVGGVHAMHDATEGGVAAGLQEIAWASNVSIVAYEEKIPVYEETKLICQALKIDPLKTIGSGALIISASPGKTREIVDALREKGIGVSVVGEIVDKSRGSYILRRDGTKLDLSEPVKEELWRVLGKKF